MPEIRPTVPGIERNFGFAPFDDTGKNLINEPLHSRPLWTPSGLTAFNHHITVSIPTGALHVNCVDLMIPYYGMALGASRTLDVTGQHMQRRYIQMHPNTDPIFHFFGNWQLTEEAQATPVWNHSYPELALADGYGDAALYYREEPEFQINARGQGFVEGTLLAYGIPRSTLQTLGWSFEADDDLLRTRQGGFSLVTGKHLAGTLVDVPSTRLWRFFPIQGAARRYTSRYFYRDYIAADGIREVSFPLLVDLQTDALGHTIQFVPEQATPPYRTYVLSDGTQKELAFELESYVTYLDGDRPGKLVKTLFTTRLIDRTKAANNRIRYQYDEDFLVKVIYPSAEQERSVRYTYDTEGHLIQLTDVYGHSFHINYVEDLLDADERLLPRLKVASIEGPEGNSVHYEYDHPEQRVTVTFISTTGETSTTTFHYQQDEGDTNQRYLVEKLIPITRGKAAPQVVRTQYIYSTDGHFNIVEMIDPLGNTSRQDHDDFNLVTATTNPLGHRQEYTYDVRSLPTSDNPHRYDLLHIHELNNDLNGIFFNVDQEATYAHFDATNSSFSADNDHSTHRISSFTNELGAVWNYIYDDLLQNRPIVPTQDVDPLGC